MHVEMAQDEEDDDDDDDGEEGQMTGSDVVERVKRSARRRR